MAALPKNDESRILVIGDTHEPFCRKDYIDHCYKTYVDFKCSRVIHIGDVVDNHYCSYHETDPNGYGGEAELQRAIDRVQDWVSVFPTMDVLIGNHDRLISRRMNTSGVPKQWLRSYSEVLNTPNWNWCERVVYDDVQYVHGEGMGAAARAKADMMSTVQGHRHTECYVQHFTGNGKNIFAVQVGTGIDRDAYSFGYAKHFKRQALACAVIIGGHTAINCVMNV